MLVVVVLSKMGATTQSMADGEDAGTELTCEHCGYEWTYNGDLWQATCPRCNKKTPTGLKPDDFDE
jgi:rubrerythrin